jgi:hypothetical protein
MLKLMFFVFIPQKFWSVKSRSTALPRAQDTCIVPRIAVLVTFESDQNIAPYFFVCSLRISYFSSIYDKVTLH